MPPASLPLPPVSGWASGEPAAALPPPLNLNDRSIAVTSAWKVFLSKVDITAGLLATTEASPLADAAPAIERPWALTLFSLSRKAAAWAWLKAMAPAMPSARAVICTRRGWVCIAGSLSVGRFLRSEEHTSELQSIMRISYAVFCLQRKKLAH